MITRIYNKGRIEVEVRKTSSAFNKYQMNVTVIDDKNNIVEGLQFVLDKAEVEELKNVLL